MKEPTYPVVPPETPFRKNPQAVGLFVAFAGLALGGLAVARYLEGDVHAGLVSAAAFVAVVSAAMLISWGAEAAQFFVSQGFAVALIALLQVMPEFMVEAVIAWNGEIENMFANATGSNRLLIGLGWPLIYFTADIFHKLRHGRGVGEVRLRRENILEVGALVVASSWYLKLLLFGSLTLFDGLLLGAMYVAYMWILAKLPAEEAGAEQKSDLLVPPRAIVEMRKGPSRAFVMTAIFVVGGGTMALVSGPFVGALKSVADSVGIQEFVFIQWVAPFLSEFPEKVTAFYWARTIRLAPMALLNMISSTVSQFTLLVGMIPIVYAVSWWTGHIDPALHEVTTGFLDLPIVPMVTATHDLRPEVFLSWAVTLLGCAMLAKLRFTRTDAALLFIVWLLQFLAGPLEGLVGLGRADQHWVMGYVCVALAAGQLFWYRRELVVREALRETFALMRGELTRKG